MVKPTKRLLFTVLVSYIAYVRNGMGLITPRHDRSPIKKSGEGGSTRPPLSPEHYRLTLITVNYSSSS